jgi:hypothetical protein
MFLNFRVGPDQFIKIPLGFEMSVMAGGVARAMDKYFNDNPNAFYGYASDVWQAASPVSISSVGVPVVSELMETQSNYDPYYQKNIIPTNEVGTALSERKGTGKASAISQGISTAMLKSMGYEADPRMIDHWMKGLFTNTWKALSTTVDVAAGKKDWQDALSAWVGMTAGSPGFGSPSVQKLYEQARYHGDINSSRMRYFSKLIGSMVEEKEPAERERKKREIVRIANEYLQYYDSIRKE